MGIFSAVQDQLDDVIPDDTQTTYVEKTDPVIEPGMYECKVIRTEGKDLDNWCIYTMYIAFTHEGETVTFEDTTFFSKEEDETSIQKNKRVKNILSSKLKYIFGEETSVKDLESLVKEDLDHQTLLPLHMYKNPNKPHEPAKISIDMKGIWNS